MREFNVWFQFGKNVGLAQEVNLELNKKIPIPTVINLGKIENRFLI